MILVMRDVFRDNRGKEMNGYVCFYGSQRFECRASSLYAAKLLAVAHFKAPKSKQHMVSVTLAEKNGEQIVHIAAD